MRASLTRLRDVPIIMVTRYYAELAREAIRAGANLVLSKPTNPVVEARRAIELVGEKSRPIAFLGYALAKMGKRAEARAELDRLLKLSTERYVSPYNIAMIYHGLGDRNQTLEWFERGYQQHEPRMVFLKVEPKWNDLRDDPSFRDLLRRVGFTP